MGDGTSTNSSRISPPKPEAGEPSSARNHSRLPDEDTESNGLVIPSIVDDKTNTSSSDECTRLTFKPVHGHERSKPTVRDNGSSIGGTSSPREPGRRNASRRTPRGDPHRALGTKGQCSDSGAARVGDERRKKDRRQECRLPEDAEKCSQSSSSDCVKDVEDQKIARAHDTKTSQSGRHRDAEHRITKKDGGIDEKESDAETEVNRTTGHKSTGGTDFENNGRSKQDSGLNIQGTRDDDSNNDDDKGDSNGGDRGRGKRPISRGIERVEPRCTQPAGDAATSGAMEGECGTDDGKKSFRRDHDCVASTPVRTCSSDNENVETIELDEKTPDRKGPTRQAQQGTDGPALENELKRSNQDEERELDGEPETDVFVPPLEILDWEGPRQGQSATSRLHRHISGNDAEALGSANVTPPPPKEFLASQPLQSPARVRGQNGGNDMPDGKKMEPESLHLENGLKPARNGRRTSAADLEWNDGAEARDVSFSRHVLARWSPWWFKGDHVTS